MTVALITVLTHQGQVRSANEDAITVASFVRSGSMTVPVELAVPLLDPVVCLVADGMGGHTSGEVASGHVARRLADVVPFLEDESAVAAALEAVNEELFDLMDRDPALRGMGSTVVGFRLSPQSFLHFNVGDSRLYRFDGEYLVQMSTDDNPGARQVDEFGRPVEVTTSVVTQALGAADERLAILPHVAADPVSGDERWLLCSDGLSGPVSIDEMEGALRAPGSDSSAVSELFRLAMAAGGPDNISIVLVRLVTGVEPVS